MRCQACGSTVSQWSGSPQCPACHAVSGAALPLPDQRRSHSALWLWTSDHARAALATGDLAVIVRAYRAATGASQRQLAGLLGYDPTYISMIETGRRQINDVAARLRIARHLGVPPHALGISDPEDADFKAMLQFGASTIRLAVLARQAGHGAEAVNELWPLVTRLETRVAEGHTERDVLLLLTRARAELGASLGYVLPEERLASAARWTGRALRLAERLDQQELLILALRVHGNELRKIDHVGGAVSHLEHAAQLASDRARGAVLVQLARAVGELGDPARFDRTIDSAWRFAGSSNAEALASRYAVTEVHLRGLMRTGRPRQAMNMLAGTSLPSVATPPQWQAMLQVTVGEVLLAGADLLQAATAFRSAIVIAERHRLPHQIQRIVRTGGRGLPAVHDVARQALDRLMRGYPADRPAGGA
ncbi:MAG: helix-turn-helix transcriptional regulator [Actinobacteria bacterium]|nr:MAG: helix-turn-helix transcriptional regulator [Actinomycetota bacterium]